MLLIYGSVNEVKCTHAATFLLTWGGGQVYKVIVVGYEHYKLCRKV